MTIFTFTFLSLFMAKYASDPTCKMTQFLKILKFNSKYTIQNTINPKCQKKVYLCFYIKVNVKEFKTVCVCEETMYSLQNHYL